MPDTRETQGLRVVAHTLGLDRAVSFTVIGRAMTMLGGVIAAAFVVRYLSRVEQGFHYTFLSLLTAQVFFELGFAYTTMQLAAHEKASLEWTPAGQLVGDRAALGRLGALQRITVRWAVAAAACLALGLVPAGLWFFAQADAPGVTWRLPWVCLVAASALALAAAPILALLEGCGQVARVAAVRSAATIASQATLCGALFLGAGLYAAPLAASVAALVPIAWLLTAGWSALAGLTRVAKPGALSWRRDVWPLQWKLSLSWLSGFFIYYAFNPIIFRIAGPVEAGRFGLALTLTSTLSTVGLAWVSTRVPTLSSLIAQRRYADLDALFERSLRQALAAAGALAVALVLVVATLAATGHPLSDRLVRPPAFVALVLAALANLVASSEAVYLRSWRRDPFLGISMLTALLVSGGAMLAMPRYGTPGVAAMYLVVMTVVMLGGGHAIFSRRRAAWQRDAP